MDETKGQGMTDQDIVLQALGRAQDVLAAYVEPGYRDANSTINRLLDILDDGEVVQAHERLTWKRRSASAARLRP